MNRIRIFNGTAGSGKKELHPVVLLLLLAYVGIALFFLFSSSGGGRIALPGPVLIFLIIRSLRKSSNKAAYMDKDEAGHFFFGLKTMNGPTSEYTVADYRYWYYHSRGRYHLVLKLETGNQTLFLTEKRETRPNDSWKREDRKADAGVDGDNLFTVPGLDRLVGAMERSDSEESFY